MRGMRRIWKNFYHVIGQNPIKLVPNRYYQFRIDYEQHRFGTNSQNLQRGLPNAYVIKVSDEINNDFKREVTNLQSNYTREKATTIDRMLFDLYGLTEEERKVIGYIEIK